MSGGNRPRATLRPGPVKSGRPRRLAFQRLVRSEPGGGQRCCAEDDLSPAGDGGEGGGALHGVADEAEVGGGIGGEIRREAGGRRMRGAMGMAETVVAGIGHARR